MEYVIGSSNHSFDFGADGVSAKLQSIRFLISSYIGEVCMDRNVGWHIPVDDPVNFVESAAATELIELIESNMEGVKVESVDFISEKQRLKPVIKVLIEDD